MRRPPATGSCQLPTEAVASAPPTDNTMMAGETHASYDEAISALREWEYPMLKSSVYLDHAGSTLPSKSLMDAFAAEMTSTLYGNPHSGSWPSQLSTSRIDDIRLRLLSFFKANPADYDLVFVANATAGVRLVTEAMRSIPGGFSYAHHQACHTSLVGVREEAVQSVCLDDNGVQRWQNGETPFPTSGQTPPTTLFSYSAQSHMDGKRYPLSWSKDLQNVTDTSSSRTLTLLDAASFVATSQLDLGDPSFTADFIVLSLYKIFGFPDIGALIVRRSAESVFDDRKYFGGGTVDMVVCGKEQWHAPKSQFLHERLEDGTLPFHSIMAIDIAMAVHQRLFGSMTQVNLHTSYLSHQLLQGLRDLRHRNGHPVCVVYANALEESPLGNGPIVSFNITNSAGGWVSLAEFEKLAILKQMHIRTGGLCCPGGIASTLGLEPWEMRKNFSAGIRCGNDSDILGGKPAGVIRASLGAMSTHSDVRRFVDFLTEFFVENTSLKQPVENPAATTLQGSSGLQVKSIAVYPIKSCGGFAIPAGMQWQIRPEGLAWDREWCLIHRGSGQALSQKRYPRMTLLKPTLDFDRGSLRVTYHDPKSDKAFAEVEIPLSHDPSLLSSRGQTSSRVCGEQISAQTYASDVINDFFTNAIGVPCVLARFPPGGRGLSSRSTKARMQKHQHADTFKNLPGAFPDIPSPPDSDSEQQSQGKILLSNESPILMVYSSSVDELNKELQSRAKSTVTEAAFRANIVLSNFPGHLGQSAYSEDSWSSLRIGCENFKLLGACRRCQMVCVDQETGERKQEPFVTLAKTRRFDGKVYFGAHMRHETRLEAATAETQAPTIQIGDFVSVDEQIGT